MNPAMAMVVVTAVTGGAKAWTVHPLRLLMVARCGQTGGVAGAVGRPG